ncbi:MAG: NYN domain-containing protein [Caldilineaceae bacterium]|nr:NYN domain-containing protein [Caldilineaceae bacterium]MCB9138429.1 NYN domain-containing protein [Caldilineaceae bacterium]
MLKAGIFVDVENLNRNGGWKLQYNILKQLAEAQGTTVLRANAYLAVDVQREEEDAKFRERNERYRAAVRKNGFHLVPKEVRRYYDAEGGIYLKANADLDLAVDALLQSENLDYVLLGSGDGDFIRLVRALQTRGKRVDLLSFSNTSSDLIREVDNYFNGYLVPGLVMPNDETAGHRLYGVMHAVNEEKGYGFLTTRTGLAADAVRDDIFCHISDVQHNGSQVDNALFADLRRRHAVLEFDVRETINGSQAKKVTVYSWA